MKFNIYDKRKLWKWIFLFLSVVLVGFFLIVSNNLVNDLAKQERERMEIWANATKTTTFLCTATSTCRSLSTPSIQ